MTACYLAFRIALRHIAGMLERAAPVLIGHEIFRHSRYGTAHPLAIPRVSTCLDLCRALGWLDESNFRESPQAPAEALSRFHDPAYIAALQAAERDQAIDPELGEKYNLGTAENPVFGEIFRRPATAAGGTLLAARLIADRPGIVHNPAGGTHHGQPARASGFCYLNDPVLGLLALRDAGFSRLLYVDFDAHHGDGVQAAFDGDPSVLTISIHEDRRWPRSGFYRYEPSEGVVSLPVPRELNDNELAWLVDALVLPLGAAFGPEAVVIQAGADAIAEDPLSRLSLSNQALLAAVEAVSALCGRVIILGGGGYNPWSVGRFWAALWGRLNGRIAPRPLPAAAEKVLRGLSWHRKAGRNPPDNWFTTLDDPPNYGPVRDAVRRLDPAYMDSSVPIVADRSRSVT